MTYSRGLSEVALAVEDVRGSVDFYTDVVRLESECVEETWATLWAGAPGEQQRVILLSRALSPVKDRDDRESGAALETPSEGRSVSSISPRDLGRTHFALFVPREKLEDAVDHVRGSGVEVWGPVKFELMAAVTYYFLDPDGHLVEFWSPGQQASRAGREV